MLYHIVITLIIFLSVALLLLLRRSDEGEFFNGPENKNFSCDFFSGKCFDGVADPLYNGEKCSFNEYEFTCVNHAHNELEYQNWRWHPDACDLPRLNGSALLEKLRGKKLLFVGDSLNRNQWRSLLCIIESFLPPSTNKTLILKGNFNFFHSPEYNATIGFYWAPLLLESNNDDFVRHQAWPRIVRANSIEKHGREWLDADILIFDSFAWWSKHVIILWGSFQSPDAIYRKTNSASRVFEMALSSWSDWLEMNLNRTKTKVFFMSASPFRKPRGKYANMDETCKEIKEPIMDENDWASEMDKEMMRRVESVIDKLGRRGVRVEYLNITRLSGYRDDARPSTKVRGWDEVKKDVTFLDCLHWCLPGVPDVWNRILYHHIMSL